MKNTTLTIQLYEVKRPDGRIEYWEGSPERGYSPVGGGFVIKGFGPTTTIRAIDSLPQGYKMGFCSIDGGEKFTCLCNPIDRWNGWAKPYILATDANDFIKMIGNGASIDGAGKITIPANEGMMEEEPTIIEPQKLQGYNVYNVGDLGWVWDFHKG